MVKELKEGVLGVVIVALAIAVALFGSYLAGMTAETKDITAYEYLADVSGLFDYDKSPQYIEYDPSTNYTGYYSTTTGDYWPTEVLGYTPAVDSNGNPKVNNYKVNLEPNREFVLGLLFGDAENENIPGTNHKLDSIGYYKNPIGSRIIDSYGDNVYRGSVHSTTLATVVDTMSADSGQTEYELSSLDKIRLSSQYSIDDDRITWYDPLALDGTNTHWIVFYIPEWIEKWERDVGPLHSEGYVLPIINPEYYSDWDWKGVPFNSKAMPCLSCEIDVNSRLATIYVDNDFKVAVGTYPLNQVSVAYLDQSVPLQPIYMGTAASIWGYNYPPAQYIDPKQGIYMIEEADE